MAILLEGDEYTPPQSHLDELTARVTVLFVSVLMLTVVWSFFVDDVLGTLLTMLNPCRTDCMNVYDPAQWSAVRWSASLLLSLFSVLPLMLHHLHQFARPGLLQAEFTALRRWTVSSAILVVVAAYFLVTEFLPELYLIGYDQHLAAGLQGQYNAVHLLMLAIYLVWVVWLFSGTWLMVRLVGATGLLTKMTADWWRWRIYGLGTLLLIVTVPSHAHSLALPLVLAYVTTTELVGRTWYEHQPTSRGHIATRFDAEGRRRRYALVDCSCEGANQHHGFADVSGCSTVEATSVCRFGADREAIIEHALRAGITDVVITGCDTRACPKEFVNNIAGLGAQLHGLDLMHLQNHLVELPQRALDVELSLATLVNKDTPNTDLVLSRILEEHGHLPMSVSVLPYPEQGWGSFSSTSEQRLLPPHQSRA